MDLQNHFKRPRVTSATATPALKRAVWDMYISAGQQEAPCPLCRRFTIYRTANSGFQAAHIVAKRYFEPTETPLSVYYVTPSCATCNNEMGDMCLLDYLYVLNRMQALRNIIGIIYAAYMEEHARAMPAAGTERLIFNVLENLYGAKRFPLGGNIANTTAIYEIARIEQLHSLVEEATQHTVALQRIANEQRLLMESEIKRMKFE